MYHGASLLLCYRAKFPTSDIQVGDAPLSTDGLLNLPKKYVFIGFPYFFTENYNTFQ